MIPLCSCGRHGDHESCGCCGAPLCGVCFEMDGGFCAGMVCATPERLAAMHELLSGPEEAADAN